MSYGTRSYAKTTYGDGTGTSQPPPVVYYPNTAKQDGVWQVDENIGYLIIPIQDGTWQVDENIIEQSVSNSSSSIFFKIIRGR